MVKRWFQQFRLSNAGLKDVAVSGRSTVGKYLKNNEYYRVGQTYKHRHLFHCSGTGDKSEPLA